MATTQSITTAEQLLQATDLGRCELLRGELIMMSPPGFEHGRIVVRLGGRLGAYAEKESLGLVAAGDPGFLIAQDPDTVRAPDVAFIGADRVPNTPIEGYFQGAPDLAVEVLSPTDRAGEVLAKVQDWLDAGCRAVWLVDPKTRTVTVYHSRTDIVVLRESDELTGGEVVPGFAVPVAEIFAA